MSLVIHLVFLAPIASAFALATKLPDAAGCRRHLGGNSVYDTPCGGAVSEHERLLEWAAIQLVGFFKISNSPGSFWLGILHTSFSFHRTDIASLPQ